LQRAFFFGANRQRAFFFGPNRLTHARNSLIAAEIALPIGAAIIRSRQLVKAIKSS
jgi:hypothetical protein